MLNNYGTLSTNFGKSYVEDFYIHVHTFLEASKSSSGDGGGVATISSTSDSSAVFNLFFLFFELPNEPLKLCDI
jgi:hypothetical protein